jgi:hypothetical protein
MSREHLVSRRASLKGLGTMGAALALGQAAAAAGPTGSRPAEGSQEKTMVDVVEVATGRMAKGHS